MIWYITMVTVSGLTIVWITNKEDCRTLRVVHTRSKALKDKRCERIDGAKDIRSMIPNDPVEEHSVAATSGEHHCQNTC